MKRSKTDTINATIESYLKRRHYQSSEMFDKSERLMCKSSEEVTLNVTAERGASRDNSIVLSAIASDVSAADQAYQRLKAWISVVPNSKLKMELKGLLYPVFCHLYLEMLHAGNRQAALQFLKTHQGDFPADTEKDFLEELSSVFSAQDIELRPLVSAFRTRKYKVDLSDVAHTCLQQFLSKHGHVILMQIINTHVTVIIKMESSETDAECNDTKEQRELGINGHVEQPSGTGVDREMRELQEAIRLIRNSAYRPLRVFKVNNANDNASCAAMSSNMNKLAIGFGTAEIRLWGINDTVLVKPKHKPPSVVLDCDMPSLRVGNDENDRTVQAGAVLLRGHTDVIHDLRFITEREILISASSDTDMRAWRLADCSCAAVYSGHNYPIWCMDASIFNLYVATGSHDRTAKLWSLERTFPLRIFAGHFLDVNSVKFHPNARYLATGSADKTVRLWDKDDGSLLRVYVGARSTIYSLAFSPDGKYLAAAGDDKSISIWDLATNALLTDLKGHEDTVMNLDWSSDGRYIASASTDGVVRLWPTRDYVTVIDGAARNTRVDADASQSYATRCTSVLSLGYYKKYDSLICVGTAKHL